MPRFRFRPRSQGEDYDTYEQAFIAAWTEFCARRKMSPFPAWPHGDQYLDACAAAREFAARPGRLGNLCRRVRVRLTSR
ncbi:hypothetical protein SMD44_p10202 (plasmid) [Streptomyces alboflavus]|uniref:Uncharacterized protein n=1 Tax=Streptomyces alboflavus TaxID=67267 RepID=A0A291W4Y9_9ACTN|nr:hypothetical protein [Streptomyces alboflavus]ATM24701.1 hypothetical protein SMD44_p10202 [Streptomyces alboflavus]